MVGHTIQAGAWAAHFAGVLAKLHARMRKTEIFMTVSTTANGAILGLTRLNSPSFGKTDDVPAQATRHTVYGRFGQRARRRRQREPVAGQCDETAMAAPIEPRLPARDRELADALEAQAATSEILRVISRSPADVQPVFDTIVANAVRLCEANFAFVALHQNGWLTLAARTGCSPEFAAYLARGFAVNRETTSGRAALERQPVMVIDFMAEPGMSVTPAHRSEDVRTVLGVPLLCGDRLLGIIAIWRHEVRPFTPRQIALLQTFADQAVIAIENVRLFTALEARNRELTEALEHQTATGEILRVLSQIPNDVQPVFDAIVKSGVRLFKGAAVAISRHAGGQVRSVAIAEDDPERAARWRNVFPFPLSREYIHGAAILDCRVVDVPDVQVAGGQFEVGKRNLAPSGYRAMTVVPLVREGVAIGAIAVVRMTPGRLSDKQIALLKTFASQAVIAIENVRLFKETKEALERQTATAEVLRVISGSITDTQPVFDVIAERARA
ncbi:GAF domain-containing protein [Polaromonas sp. P1(28)-13]|nr:GAF domain-containing protein [Polaromonas sp. P1(28)-13]